MTCLALTVDQLELFGLYVTAMAFLMALVGSLVAGFFKHGADVLFDAFITPRIKRLAKKLYPDLHRYNGRANGD
jgi:hypothetical protein